MQFIGVGILQFLKNMQKLYIILECQTIFILKENIYYKDGKAKHHSYQIKDGEQVGWSIYAEKNKSNPIMILENTKTFLVVETVTNMGINGNIPYNYNYYELQLDDYFDSPGWDNYKWYYKFLAIFEHGLGPVIPTKYNGRKCYEINDFIGYKIYIDRKTYLPFASFASPTTTEPEFYETKLNVVTDEDVTLPDLSEYTQSIQ